jgi:transposase
MNELPPIDPSEMSETEWNQTPLRVRQFVQSLMERLERVETALAGMQQDYERLSLENQQLRRENQQLRRENQQLKEHRHQNSQNSSQPPSQDPPGTIKPKPQDKRKRQRGGQPGHPGHGRKLYPPEHCQSIEDHYPQTCWDCGKRLQGVDPQPQRIQIVELPPLAPIVTEHRFHNLECSHCGSWTRAFESDIVNGKGYGERLSALVGLLSGEYRQSHPMVVRLLAEVFGIEISVGSINQLRGEISEAIAVPVAQAQAYVQAAPTVGSDETSFRQGNGDGHNPTLKQGWLWVLVTPWVCYFAVALSRAQAVAIELLGATFGGNLITDRYGGYNWLELSQRQVCWAHLKRDFTKISERSGVSKEIGEALLEEQRLLFACWHRVRDGTWSRAQLSEAVAPIRHRVQAVLSEAAELAIGAQEKTPLAKTVRTCRQLLKVEPALWLFVTTEGVEPTNNAAERALRPAVLWRKSSFGAQSATGSLFVSRMLTVVTTLRLQQRNVLDYLTHACRAKRQGQSPPSLLPTGLDFPNADAVAAQPP